MWGTQEKLRCEKRRLLPSHCMFRQCMTACKTTSHCQILRTSRLGDQTGRPGYSITGEYARSCHVISYSALRTIFTSMEIMVMVTVIMILTTIVMMKTAARFLFRIMMIVLTTKTLIIVNKFESSTHAGNTDNIRGDDGDDDDDYDYYCGCYGGQGRALFGFQVCPFRSLTEAGRVQSERFYPFAPGRSLKHELQPTLWIQGPYQGRT